MTKDVVRERVAKWLEVLRSNEFNKTRLILCRPGSLRSKPEVCVLGAAGVAYHKAMTGLEGPKLLDTVFSTLGRHAVLPEEICEWFGMGKEPMVTVTDELVEECEPLLSTYRRLPLSAVNDGTSLSLAELADLVEFCLNHEDTGLFSGVSE